ncbi:MAG: hypothetical protein IID49_03155 [Proteobacteria bacterium]|nr:hypothetical protein [Pseudomonadota bacterium]
MELHNISATNVLIGTDASHATPWRVRGAINYEFPAGAEVAAGDYALPVQGINGGDPAAEEAAFRAARGVPASVPIFIYTDQVNGSLSNDSEKIFLERPLPVTGIGDLDGDEFAGLTDLATLLANLGTIGGATPSQGDLNGDGNVDRVDAALLIEMLGSTVATGTAYILQDAVKYDDGTNDPQGWPANADGQGSALGRDGPRSYAEAYYWASLAAAAGDRSSAGLRERLDQRFAGAGGAAREAWKGVSQGAAAHAIETWTSGGLGARVAALYGLAQ